jgi:hypothetical protein
MTDGPSRAVAAPLPPTGAALPAARPAALRVLLRKTAPAAALLLLLLRLTSWDVSAGMR